MIDLKIGDSVSGFLLTNKEEIKDINSVGYMFEHIKSGARLMYIDNEDDNKVFFIGFRTPPIDDCGTPHIIEHSVLCGSKKYPVKDPFNELAKGSLNTYLNALTYSDKTVYPIASRNDKDFTNLMDVYLDAVFNPRMLENEDVFMQEGHHLHLEEADDELCEKGVVYNEMKGAFSDPDRYLEGAINTALFTDSPYRFESGGDPDKIPELTFDMFIDFYNKHYHPSNSYIYLFGKMDIYDKLNYLDSEYLSNYEKIKTDTEILPQKPVGKVISKNDKYPIIEKDGSGKEAMYGAGYITGKSYDAKNSLAYSILSYILLDTNASPLRKALTENDFCSNVEGWYDSSMLDCVFTISVKGAKENAGEEFENIVSETLKNLAEKGLDKELVLSAVNAYEFMLSEENYGYKPRGLAYGLKSMNLMLHDRLPFESFRFKKHIEEIRSEIEDGYFEKLILDGFVNNQTKVFVSLQPEEDMQAKIDAEEKLKFEELKKTLSLDEINEIVNKTKKLFEFQSSEDDLSVMPFLKLEDISKKAYIAEKKIDGNIMHVPQHTNGIAYCDFVFEISALPREAYNYVGLLSELIGRLDTKKYAFAELSTKIDMYTGGISSNCDCHLISDGQYKRLIYVKSKALVRNIAMLAELIDETTNNMLLDKYDSLKLIIKDTVSRLEGYLTQSGHITAAYRALSYYNESFEFKNETSGIGFFKFLLELDKSFDSNKEEIALKLKNTAKAIFNSKNLMMAISCEEKDLCQVKDSIKNIFSESDYKLDMPRGVEKENITSEGIITPGKIQYVAKAANYKKAGFEYSGKLLVLKNIIDLEYLWNTVRVQGGAYGCGCNMLRSGNMYMYSYRDPNLTKTLELYDKAGSFIGGFNADERSMTNYIIGVINTLDRPLSKEAVLRQTFIRYITGLTDDKVQKERNEVLSSTCKDMNDFSKLLNEMRESKYICVIGNGDNINKNSELFDRVLNLK